MFRELKSLNAEFNNTSVSEMICMYIDIEHEKAACCIQ